MSKHTPLFRAATVVAPLLLLAAAPLWIAGCPASSNPPKVDSLKPESGPDTGGTLITVTGARLDAPLALTLNEQAATEVQALNSQALTARTPPGAPGPATVELLFADGTVITLEAGFTYESTASDSALPPPLTITSFDPAEGPEAGGTIVTIIGSGFTPDMTVRFGTQAATSVTVLNSTLITAVAPPQPAGTDVSLTVTAPGGQNATSAGTFSYLGAGVLSIGSVAPESGPQAGGTVVTIGGTGFVPGMTVTFGGVAAEVNVLSDTLLTAVTPPGNGPVEVWLKTPDGQTAASDFDYVGPSPMISGLRPASGTEAGGTLVTISGGNLLGTTGVSFGGNLATYTVLSETLIQAIAPPGVGTVKVQIQNPAGNAQALYTYVPRDVVSIGTLDPATGPTAGGTTVVIVGTGFVAGDTVVTFGGVAAADVTVMSDVLLAAETPEHVAGAVTVQVTSSNGSAASTFTFVGPGVPTIGSIVPGVGSLDGGTPVAIGGTAFVAGKTSVLFDGSPATGVHVTSDTLLTAVTPPGNGTPLIQVVTPTGTAAASGLFIYSPLPPLTVLDAFYPDTGPISGNTRVLVHGTGFGPDMVVRFGELEGRKLKVISSTLLRVRTPAVEEPQDVLISAYTTDGQTATSNSAFHYVP